MSKTKGFGGIDLERARGGGGLRVCEREFNDETRLADVFDSWSAWSVHRLRSVMTGEVKFG